MISVPERSDGSHWKSTRKNENNKRNQSRVCCLQRCSSYPALYEKYKDDTRSGVQKLIEQCHKKEVALEAEKQRIEGMKVYEHKYEHLGYLCGIDEVGRGPLAGPVVACAVILPQDCHILYLNDSKKLVPQKEKNYTMSS